MSDSLGDRTPALRARDPLGSRMKGQYEHRARVLLPRRTYTLIRVDGKAFHTYTKGCQRPFDEALMRHMDYAAVELCRQAQGAQVGFVQSDEISVLLTDFASEKTDAWFDGNIQKIASISASIVTAHFNALRAGHGVAYFDARVWSVPDPTEVENYFIWRQQDATRNSISMLAQHHFSHADLQSKSGAEMQEMLMHWHNVNWNDQPTAFKRGRAIVKDQFKPWQSVEPPIFTSDEGRPWLQRQIPRYA